MSIGCGAGGSCCETCRGGGLGGGDYNAYPGIVAVLQDYVETMIAARKPFYISPEVNSAALSGDGNFGFAFAAIIPALTSLANSIGPSIQTAAQVAGLSSALKGSGGGKSAGPTSADIAAAVTPAVVAQLQAQGIQLPAAVANKVTSAGLADIFGTNTKPILIAAAVGLVAMLIMRRR